MKARQLFILLFGLIFVLAGCAPAAQTEPVSTEVVEPAPVVEQPPEAPEPTTAPEPATLRVGWAGSPDSLNPGVGTLMEAYTIYELVYETIYNLELDGSYKLELAESAEVSEDGLVWTFKMRPGAKWHDGQPVTAGDAAFTLNYYAAHEDFPYMSTYTV